MKHTETYDRAVIYRPKLNEAPNSGHEISELKSLVLNLQTIVDSINKNNQELREDMESLHKDNQELRKDNLELREFVKKNNSISIRQMDAQFNFALNLETRVSHIMPIISSPKYIDISGEASNVSMVGILCQWLYDMKDCRLVIHGQRNNALCCNQSIGGRKYCPMHQAIICAYSDRRNQASQ